MSSIRYSLSEAEPKRFITYRARAGIRTVRSFLYQQW
jgi:hypothetical protein